MNRLLKALWCEDHGVLSFEWVLLLTLLTIGVVSGIAGARDAIIDELADIAEASISIDQSFSIAAFTTADITTTGFSYTDDTTADLASFSDCDRTSSPLGQGGLNDGTDGG